MNLIELVSEKVSKKQIMGVVTLAVLLQIEAPPLVKVICVTIVGITAIVTQAYLDYEKKKIPKID